MLAPELWSHMLQAITQDKSYVSPLLLVNHTVRAEALRFLYRGVATVVQSSSVASASTTSASEERECLDYLLRADPPTDDPGPFWPDTRWYAAHCEANDSRNGPSAAD